MSSLFFSAISFVYRIVDLWQRSVKQKYAIMKGPGSSFHYPPCLFLIISMKTTQILLVKHLRLFSDHELETRFQSNCKLVAEYFKNDIIFITRHQMIFDF